MSSAFINPEHLLNDKQKLKAKALRIVGAICGGLFLGCASGGAVYLAAQATGLVIAGSIVTTSIFLGLSAILALAWGLIYQKDIGEALIPQLLFNGKQKAMAKFNKQFDKDLNLVKWTLRQNLIPNEQRTTEEETAKTSDTPSDTDTRIKLSMKEFLILHQLKYLIAKQLLKDAAQHALTESMPPWDKSIRQILLNKSFEPRKAWFNEETVEGFLKSREPGKSRAIAFEIYKSLSPSSSSTHDQSSWTEHVSQDNILSRLKSEWTELLNTRQELNDTEALCESVRNWMNRAPVIDKSSAFDETAATYIINRYNNKIKGHHWLYRALFKIVNAIAILNATLVNTVGMGAGGLAIVSAILSLFGTSLSLPMAFMTMAIFATGGFAGAFFLTRSTMKASAHRFANWMRAQSDKRSKRVYMHQTKSITDQVQHHTKNNNFVLRWPFLLRAILAFCCAVGFAGFNLVTGMTMMAIWFNPQSVLDPNLVRDLVSNAQPWYILGSGLASALVTFIVVLSFMLKFSTDYNNESKATKSHWIVGAFIGISAILNTFVCLANYFSGSLWTNLWLNFLGVSNPAIITGFGVLMGISALIIGIPVFEVLRDRVNDLSGMCKSSEAAFSNSASFELKTPKVDSPPVNNEDKPCVKIAGLTPAPTA